jgi:drug/metabolite transporter (DMT)-like permease
MKSYKGYLYVLSATLFWGISATVAKFLFNQQTSALVLVQLRMTISCLLLVSFFVMFKREYLRLKRADVWKFIMLGVFGSAACNFTYYYTIKETNVATAILLQYLAPLLVLAYAAYSKEEKLSVGKIVAGIVSLAGCFLAVGGENFSLSSISNIGLLTGFLSAGTWAFSNVAMRRLMHSYNAWTVLIYSFVFASLFWFFVNSPLELIEANYSADTWLMFSGFAIISILIPHSFYYNGIKHLTAARAIITASFEPIVAIGSAFLFINEELTLVQIIGALLVIIAIIILQWKREDLIHD